MIEGAGGCTGIEWPLWFLSLASSWLLLGQRLECYRRHLVELGAAVTHCSCDGGGSVRLMQLAATCSCVRGLFLLPSVPIGGWHQRQVRLVLAGGSTDAVVKMMVSSSAVSQAAKRPPDTPAPAHSPVLTLQKQPTPIVTPAPNEVGASAHKVKYTDDDKLFGINDVVVKRQELADACGCGLDDKCWAPDGLDPRISVQCAHV